ncbi:MAG TPA: hypothetical protein VGE52_08205, partial [Pirellulales bacterium]
GGTTAAQMTSERPGGLYRREVDRSTSLWSSQEGEITTLDDNAKPLAPEVSAIQFQYHDGTAWTTAWDSSEMGAPPLAVEVVVTVRSPRRSQSIIASSLGGWTGDGSDFVETQYRVIVHVPGASRAALEEAGITASEETEGTTSGSSSGATSSRSTGSTSGGATGARSPSGGGASSGAGGAGR